MCHVHTVLYKTIHAAYRYSIKYFVQDAESCSVVVLQLVCRMLNALVDVLDHGVGGGGRACAIMAVLL